MEGKVVLYFRKLDERAEGGKARDFKCIVSVRINSFIIRSSYILAVMFIYLILNSFCHFESTQMTLLSSVTVRRASDIST